MPLNLLPSSALRFLLALCTFYTLCTSLDAQAFGNVRQPNLEYVETHVDLKVKVLGGHVQVKRTWSEGRW